MKGLVEVREKITYVEDLERIDKLEKDIQLILNENEKLNITLKDKLDYI